MQGINLIPEQEVQEQQKTKAIKLSSVISILVLLITGGVSGYYIYQAYQINQQISDVNTEIKGLRSSIATQAPIEINARNLDKKYTTLNSTFSSQNLYSRLASELAARTPNDVLLDAFILQKGTKASISGSAPSYVSIATFTTNLLNTSFPSGDARLKDLFTTVTLNSVNLEKSRNIVRFAITVDLNTKDLRSN